MPRSLAAAVFIICYLFSLPHGVDSLEEKCSGEKGTSQGLGALGASPFPVNSPYSRPISGTAILPGHFTQMVTDNSNIY